MDAARKGETKMTKIDTAKTAIELSIREGRTITLEYSEALAGELGAECDSCEVDSLYWGGRDSYAWQVELVPARA